MEPDRFLLRLAEDFVRDLTANHSIKDYTTNPAIIGGYAEATVRELVKRVVWPFRVSRGAIIYEDICPRNVPELDLIVWLPCPMPAVFEAGDFALVPRASALAFLEVKRSNYRSDLSEHIAATLAREPELIQPQLMTEDGKPVPASLGVVCIRERTGRDRKLEDLAESGRAVVLLDWDKDDGLRANASDVYRLVNFLMGVRRRAAVLDGSIRVAWPPRPAAG